MPRINIVVFEDGAFKVKKMDAEYVFQHQGFHIAVHQCYHDKTLYSVTELETGFGVTGINTLAYPENPRKAVQIAKKNIQMYDVAKCKREQMEEKKHLKFPLNAFPPEESYENGIARIPRDTNLAKY